MVGVEAGIVEGRRLCLMEIGQRTCASSANFTHGEKHVWCKILVANQQGLDLDRNAIELRERKATEGFVVRVTLVS